MTSECQDLHAFPPWPPDSVERHEVETIEVARAQWEHLNCALARESAKVHQQQRELLELRNELERMRNAD